MTTPYGCDIRALWINNIQLEGVRVEDGQLLDKVCWNTLIKPTLAAIWSSINGSDRVLALISNTAYVSNQSHDVSAQSWVQY